VERANLRLKLCWTHEGKDCVGVEGGVRKDCEEAKEKREERVWAGLMREIMV